MKVCKKVTVVLEMLKDKKPINEIVSELEEHI